MKALLVATSCCAILSAPATGAAQAAVHHAPDGSYGAALGSPLAPSGEASVPADPFALTTPSAALVDSDVPSSPLAPPGALDPRAFWRVDIPLTIIGMVFTVVGYFAGAGLGALSNTSGDLWWVPAYHGDVVVTAAIGPLEVIGLVLFFVGVTRQCWRLRPGPGAEISGPAPVLRF